MKIKTISLILAMAGAAVGVSLYQRYTLAERGERTFQRLGCGGCHFSGAGPNLTHVVQKHDPEFLERFIASPDAVYHERGMRPLNDGYMLMPEMHASPEDAKAIIEYLRKLDRE
ncbi:MAG: c-type cytochrome [Terriglobales bacterium]